MLRRQLRPVDQSRDRDAALGHRASARVAFSVPVIDVHISAPLTTAELKAAQDQRRGQPELNDDIRRNSGAAREGGAAFFEALP